MPSIRNIGLAELKKIYNDRMRKDFPPGELRPYFAMASLYRKGQYLCYGWDEDGDLLAYACFYTVEGNPCVLLDNYAVDETKRGMGIGGEFLKALNEIVPAEWGILIEAERIGAAKTDDQRFERERRIRFYEHNGGVLTDTCCYLFGVDYSIIFLPKDEVVKNNDELWDATVSFYKEAYGRVYGKLCKPYRGG